LAALPINFQLFDASVLHTPGFTTTEQLQDCNSTFVYPTTPAAAAAAVGLTIPQEGACLLDVCHVVSVTQATVGAEVLGRVAAAWLYGLGCEGGGVTQSMQTRVCRGSFVCAGVGRVEGGGLGVRGGGG
jgi:hypothetical protein